MNKLLPCPFCGGEAEVLTWKRARTTIEGCLTNNHSVVEKLKSKYLVKCKNKQCNACRPSTKYFFVKKEAIEAWNRRADK